MVFLKINEIDDDKIKKLKHYYTSPAKIFMLIYMNGCGPCNETKPEWSKLENVLDNYKTNEDIIIVDIEKDVLNQIKLPEFKEIMAFPTILYIKNKKQENYEDAPNLTDAEKDRKIDSFVKWIKSKTSENNENANNKQEGGRKTQFRRKLSNKKTRRFTGILKRNQRAGKWSLKYKHSINCNHPKGFSQKQYCKYSRKK
jgi:thiol-disulfide isomerase/thioredoxin